MRIELEPSLKMAQRLLHARKWNQKTMQFLIFAAVGGVAQNQ
jgi:hypothetical protein